MATRFARITPYLLAQGGGTRMRDGKSGDIFTFCTRRKRSVYSIVARFSFTTKSPNPQKRLGDHRPTEPCTPHSRNNAAQHLGRAGFRNGKARARSQYTNIGKHPHEASAERCRPTKGRCPSDCVTAPTSSTCVRHVNRLDPKQAPRACFFLSPPASSAVGQTKSPNPKRGWAIIDPPSRVHRILGTLIV